VNIAISLTVIKLASEAVWGAFVHPLIWVTLAAHVMGWGNKEYLLRTFSQSPATLFSNWWENWWTRLSALPIIAVLFFLFFAHPGLAALAVLWLAAAFANQSFDALALYHRKFGVAIFIEVAGFLLVLAGLLWRQNSIDIRWLSALYTGQFALKSGLWALVFARPLWGAFRVRWRQRHFLAAFPFFLIGASGFLQSKTDLYVVNYLLPDEAVGTYQVLINLFIYLQAFAGFMLIPFAKNIYRLPEASILKLNKKLLPAGLALLAVGLPASYLVLNRVYGFSLEWPVYGLAALLVLPIFYYLPLIYLFFKRKREKVVVGINALGIAVNLGGNLLLIPAWGIEGALLATATGQWCMAGAYFYGRQKWRGR